MAGKITGEIIKSAIARKLSASFNADGKPYKIYKERIVQGMQRPCFFIWTVVVEQTKVARNVYEWHYQMQIRHHLPDNEASDFEQLCEIGTQMLQALNTIDVPILVRNDEQELVETTLPVFGKKMEYKIDDDDVLLLYVTYDIRVSKQQDERNPMSSVTINENTRR